jgi:hypothetical protein
MGMSLRRFERDDSGIALLVVIGAVALLVVLLTAAFYVSSQTLFQTQMADQHDAAFQAASSGVLVAFADLKARIATLPSTGAWSGSMPASSAVYAVVASLNAAQTSYACTSTGTAPDGTREVVAATFNVSLGSSTSWLPWGDNVFYFAGFTGGSIVGNGTISGPFYVKFPSPPRGTLDFGSAAASLVGGPVYVENGDLVLKKTPSTPIQVYTNGTISPAGVGNVTDMGWDPAKSMPIALVDVPSFEAASLARAAAQSSDNAMGDTAVVNYEARSVGDPSGYSSLSVSPPNNRPAGWVRAKAPGAGQAYKVVTGGLTIGWATASFGSWSADGHYPTSDDLHDDFAYDAVKHVLYLEGTVYVAGDFVVSTDITYVGNGTIVCTGNAVISGSVVPATANGADGTPDPDARHLLCVFAAGNVSFTRNNASTTGAFYATGQLVVSATNNTLKGSFVTERGLGALGNGTTISAFTPIGSFVSPGLPRWGGAGGTASGLTMSGWRRL